MDWQKIQLQRPQSPKPWHLNEAQQTASTGPHSAVTNKPPPRRSRQAGIWRAAPPPRAARTARRCSSQVQAAARDGSRDGTWELAGLRLQIKSWGLGGEGEVEPLIRPYLGLIWAPSPPSLPPSPHEVTFRDLNKTFWQVARRTEGMKSAADTLQKTVPEGLCSIDNNRELLNMCASKLESAFGYVEKRHARSCNVDFSL